MTATTNTTQTDTDTPNPTRLGQTWTRRVRPAASKAAAALTRRLPDRSPLLTNLTEAVLGGDDFAERCLTCQAVVRLSAMPAHLANHHQADLATTPTSHSTPAGRSRHRQARTYLTRRTRMTTQTRNLIDATTAHLGALAYTDGDQERPATEFQQKLQDLIAVYRQINMIAAETAAHLETDLGISPRVTARLVEGAQSGNLLAGLEAALTEFRRVHHDQLASEAGESTAPAVRPNPR